MSVPTISHPPAILLSSDRRRYNRLLLLVAGMGGLLYGIDVGIIASALPYLEATARLTAGQLSFIVAAVLLGSVVSSLFAGALADGFGRKPLMVLSGLLCAASIPLIALSHSYALLVAGRLLQGVSAGLIGVVIPLYLAECLPPEHRGKGTGIFQWLLTLGFVVAAIIGIVMSMRVDAVARLGDPARLLAFKDAAWRRIFWVSLPPAALFVVGALLVAESPRWLFRRGRTAAARAALLRSRMEPQAELELQEMAASAAAAAAAANGERRHEPILQRKYLVPFVLACIVLACNQTTGVNSIIGYCTTILLQSGLSDVQAHTGYLVLALVNFLVTIGAVVLVDRKGRKFLLSVGTAGVVVSLLGVGILFRRTESRRVDCRAAVQALVRPNQTAAITFDRPAAERWLTASGAQVLVRAGEPLSLTVIYSYGDFRAATKVLRLVDGPAESLEITRDGCVPPNAVVAFFSNPFGRLATARVAPLRIENALVTPLPGPRQGWLTAIGLFTFMGFFAVGPGVCVWLALSELMPTRIRSNGMSIALLLNHVASTAIAASFLPTVGRFGYASMFFGFAGCTVVYFVTATFFLPETKGRTLEEIEAYWDRKPAREG